MAAPENTAALPAEEKGGEKGVGRARASQRGNHNSIKTSRVVRVHRSFALMMCPSGARGRPFRLGPAPAPPLPSRSSLAARRRGDGGGGMQAREGAGRGTRAFTLPRAAPGVPESLLGVRCRDAAAHEHSSLIAYQHPALSPPRFFLFHSSSAIFLI